MYKLITYQEIKEVVFSKIGKDTSKVFLSSSLAVFLTLIGSMYSLKFLSTYEIGVVAAYNNLVAILSGLVLAGINTAFVRYVSLYLTKDQKVAGILIKKIFKIEFILALIILVLLLMSAPFIANNIYNKPELVDIIRYSGINIFLMIILTFYITLFQTRRKFTFYSFFKIAQAFLISLGIIIFSYLNKLSPIIVIFIGIFVNFLFIIIGHFLAKKNEIEVDKKAKISNKLIKEIFHYSKWVIVNSVSSRLFTKTDIFMLSSMVVLSQVALYSFANSIYAAILIIPGTLGTVLLPSISSLQTTEEYSRVTKKILKYSILTSFLIIPLFFLIKPLTIWIFDTKFIESLPVVYVLLADIMIAIALNPTINMLLVLGKQKYMALTTLGVFITNIIGNLIFIPIYGIMGAVVVTASSHVVFNILQSSKVFITIKRMKKSAEI